MGGLWGLAVSLVPFFLAFWGSFGELLDAKMGDG
jgi:hypothetical protein